MLQRTEQSWMILDELIFNDSILMIVSDEP